MIGRIETDERSNLLITTAVGTTATQLVPISPMGLGAASLYLANFCTSVIHYDVKGCYDKSVTSTAYWYSLTSGTVAVDAVTSIGGHLISGLNARHAALTVEYFGSADTTGTFVMKLMCW